MLGFLVAALMHHMCCALLSPAVSKHIRTVSSLHQMWELFVGQRPYGNMSQQKVVEEVVLRGLRPSFPVGTPLGYTQLACSCWHATAGQRPTFQEIVGRLQVREGVGAVYSLGVHCSSMHARKDLRGRCTQPDSAGCFGVEACRQGRQAMVTQVLVVVVTTQAIQCIS